MNAKTVKQLIELLQSYNQDSPITNEQNESFVHIASTKDGFTILSTKTPIARCARTGSYIYPTQVIGYFGYCPELDEDVFEIETVPL